MGKRYLTCKEFTTLCGITKNTLVWYEKKGLLSPAYLGENGYHYYSPEQFYDIDLIKTLKWADKSLDECKDYMDHRTESLFINMLLEQQEVLRIKLEQLFRQKTIIDHGLQDFLMMQSEFTTEPKEITCADIFLLVEKIPDGTDRGYAQALSKLYEEFHRCFSLYGAAPCMLNAAIVKQEDLTKDKEFRRSFAGLKISEPTLFPNTTCRIFSSGTYLTCFHKGNPKTIRDTYHKMLDYIDKNCLRITNDVLEYDFVNYLSAQSPEQYCKEILIPIQREEK